MDSVGAVAAMITTAVGATWVLHSALSKIEAAISSHVASDATTHAAQDARITNLEKWRRGRR